MSDQEAPKELDIESGKPTDTVTSSKYKKL